MAKLESHKEVGPGGIKYTLTPRGGVYYFRFTYPRSGKRCNWTSTKTSVLGEARVIACAYIQTYAVEKNDPTKVTVKDLMVAYIQSQEDKGKKRNASEVQRAWDNRMSLVFGNNIQANDVSTLDIRDYKRWMTGHKVETGLFAGIKPYPRKLRTGTKNRDLASLRAAYRYAFKGGVISKLPAFEIDDNRKARRKGFLQQTEFDRIVVNTMPLWLKALLHVLYAVGIRFTEAASLTVGQVDFAARILRLEETKNGDPRNPPLTATMYELLLACAEGKKPSDLLIDTPCIWTVHDYWNELVEISGIGRKVRLHDMRRSAVRNMINRGVSEKEAMLISGHLTRWVFDNYNIIDERQMKRAAALIDAGAELEREEAEALEEAYEQVVARAKRAIAGTKKEAVQ